MFFQTAGGRRADPTSCQVPQREVTCCCGTTYITLLEHIGLSAQLWMCSASGSGSEQTWRHSQAGGLPVLQDTATELRIQHGVPVRPQRFLAVSAGREDINMNNVDDFGVLYQRLCPDAHQLDKHEELLKVTLSVRPHGDDPTPNTSSPERSVAHGCVNTDSFLWSIVLRGLFLFSPVCLCNMTVCNSDFIKSSLLLWAAFPLWGCCFFICLFHPNFWRFALLCCHPNVTETLFITICLRGSTNMVARCSAATHRRSGAPRCCWGGRRWKGSPTATLKQLQI